jgi:hypothetical protein
LFKDALLDLLKEVNFDASRLVMDFPNGVPAGVTQDHCSLMLQIWAYDRKHPATVEAHVAFMLPKMDPVAQASLCGLYKLARIYLKDD